MRVIFVGMNNKPGLAPLCSSTRSGKLIDRVIKELPPGTEVTKSNLWDLDHWPSLYNCFNTEWITRTQYYPGDIVVTLGESVRKAFVKSRIPFTHIGHPSAVWSHERQDDYILTALIRIYKQFHTLKAQR